MWSIVWRLRSRWGSKVASQLDAIQMRWTKSNDLEYTEKVTDRQRTAFCRVETQERKLELNKKGKMQEWPNYGLRIVSVDSDKYPMTLDLQKPKKPTVRVKIGTKVCRLLGAVMVLGTMSEPSCTVHVYGSFRTKEGHTIYHEKIEMPRDEAIKRGKIYMGLASD